MENTTTAESHQSLSIAFSKAISPRKKAHSLKICTEYSSKLKPSPPSISRKLSPPPQRTTNSDISPIFSAMRPLYKKNSSSPRSTKRFIKEVNRKQQTP
jgi:hypothetical protein